MGVGDSNLRYLETHFQSQITVRGGKLIIQGPCNEADKIKRVFLDLAALYKVRKQVTIEDIDTVLRLAGVHAGVNGQDNGDGKSLILEVPRGPIRSRGKHQAWYIRAMEKNPIVFANGPAGTGKTYLAVAMAVDSFQRKLVERIILVRPVVESGETLGFLPGDILEKVDPYFRPLYDALDEMLSQGQVKRLMDRGSIEIAPLAYMRGRTLNRAFVILDEAQNTTSGQMKMFLTRLGVESRAVLTGDLSQVDLPSSVLSGLEEARTILTGISGIGFIEFNENDVVRHKLVADILRAYKAQARESER